MNYAKKRENENEYSKAQCLPIYEMVVLQNTKQEKRVQKTSDKFSNQKGGETRMNKNGMSCLHIPPQNRFFNPPQKRLLLNIRFCIVKSEQQ